MWVALETKQKATIFFSNRQSQSNGSLNIYMYTYKLYFQLLHHSPPPTSWFLLAAHNGKAKMENLKKKKKAKVDSISMIQLAICYGIQGDSFSHTLA